MSYFNLQPDDNSYPDLLFTSFLSIWSLSITYPFLSLKFSPHACSYLYYLVEHFYHSFKRVECFQLNLRVAWWDESWILSLLWLNLAKHFGLPSSNIWCWNSYWGLCPRVDSTSHLLGSRAHFGSKCLAFGYHTEEF